MRHLAAFAVVLVLAMGCDKKPAPIGTTKELAEKIAAAAAVYYPGTVAVQYKDSFMFNIINRRAAGTIQNPRDHLNTGQEMILLSVNEPLRVMMILLKDDDTPDNYLRDLPLKRDIDRLTAMEGHFLDATKRSSTAYWPISHRWSAAMAKGSEASQIDARRGVLDRVAELASQHYGHCYVQEKTECIGNYLNSQGVLQLNVGGILWSVDVMTCEAGYGKGFVITLTPGSERVFVKQPRPNDSAGALLLKKDMDEFVGVSGRKKYADGNGYTWEF